MATSSSFKVQCPSCEAMVPIKDPGFIGRKIDCPKCKYRFVVEDPGEPEAEVGDEEEAPVKKGAADGKGTAVKAKAGPRRRRDTDEEDEDDRPRARPRAASRDDGGGAGKLLIGGGIAAVGAILIGVVIYFLMANEEPEPVASTPPPRAARPDADAEKPPEDGEKKDAPAAGSAISGDVTYTNLLPNDTEQVVNVMVKELLKTEYGKAIFGGKGMLHKETLERQTGIPVDNIERMVLGRNFTQNWSFNIIRTSAPVKLDDLRKALKLQTPPDVPVQGQEYFVLAQNPWLDNLSNQDPVALMEAGVATPTTRGSTALRMENDQTLIFADVNVLKSFLAKKPEHRSKPGASSTPGEQQQGGGDRPGSGMQGGQGGMPGMMMPGGGMSPGGMPQRPSMGSGMPAGMGPQDQQQGGSQEPAVTPSLAYLSVNPEMKTMLDQVENRGVLLSLATDNGKAIPALLRGVAQPVVQDALHKLVVETFLQPSQIEQVAVLGLCVNMKEGITLTGGLEFKTADQAKSRFAQVQKYAPQLARLFGEFFDLKFDVPNEETGPGLPGGGLTPPGAMMAPPGMSAPPGMMMPPGMGPGMRPGGGSKFSGGRGLEGGPTPGAPGSPGMGFVPPGGVGGMQLPSGTPEKPSEPGVGNSKLLANQVEKTIVLTLNLQLDAKAHETLMGNHVRPALIRRRGMMDMAGGQLRVHDLAAALKAYADNKKQFPRGTFERPVPSQRNGRPYPPNERIGWMADLLGFLGQEELVQMIDVRKSWKDKENLPAAMTLIPPFVLPSSSASAWWVRFPGASTDVATTQFVGVAGVGLDAAEYSATDPGVEKKLGVFGYDRITKLSDFKDSPSETIALIQVSTSFKRPWLAGGGSTVVGVPETRSIQPFVTAQPDGKRGALAVMADGQVRFIPETVSDEAFKAMCTIRGADEVQLARDTQVVPRPDPTADAPPAPAAAPVFVPPPKAEEPPAPKAEPEQPKKSAGHSGGDNQVALGLLNNICANCHTGARAKGKVQIFLSPGVPNPNAPRKEMAEAVGAGKMPPRKGPQPNPGDLAKLKDWLDSGK